MADKSMRGTCFPKWRRKKKTLFWALQKKVLNPEVLFINSLPQVSIHPKPTPLKKRMNAQYDEESAGMRDRLRQKLYHRIEQNPPQPPPPPVMSFKRYLIKAEGGARKAQPQNHHVEEEAAKEEEDVSKWEWPPAFDAQEENDQLMGGNTYEELAKILEAWDDEGYHRSDAPGVPLEV